MESTLYTFSEKYTGTQLAMATATVIEYIVFIIEAYAHMHEYTSEVFLCRSFPFPEIHTLSN